MKALLSLSTLKYFYDSTMQGAVESAAHKLGCKDEAVKAAALVKVREAAPHLKGRRG
jgi:hypothetical protein